jgi:hypothetical protein
MKLSERMFARANDPCLSPEANAELFEVYAKQVAKLERVAEAAKKVEPYGPEEAVEEFVAALADLEA